ncbi:MAG: PAS domain S-box protein [Candidatus Riflebacteria bacterium]|nr:PAS domain S-box protein [Candidatus Riflebacteria bacterium]
MDLVRSLQPMSHFCLDLETMVFTFDRDWGPMIGLPPLASQSFDEFCERVPLADRSLLRMFMFSAQRGALEILKRRIQVIDDHGEKRWFELSSLLEKPGKANQGKSVLRGIIMAISRPKEEKPELTESERWFMEVLEESPHALYRIDISRNRFDYVSKGFAQALGRTREEILAMPYTEFMMGFPLDAVAAISRQRDLLMADYKGGRFTMYVEFPFKHANGENIWLNDTFTLVPGPDGQIAYQVGFGTVIDDRKKLEEKLRETLEQLEEKVKERTASLHAANLQLTTLLEERRELEKKLLEISERERRFIGRELHDGLCQQIAGVMCMSEAVYRKLKAKTVSEHVELAMMRDFLHDAVQQTRTLARGLCPLALDPQAIGDALSTLASQASYMYKIDCRFEGKPEFTLPDPNAALHLYRITQEAIQNAVRHGKARSISIGLKTDSQNLRLVVENDGRALPDKKKEPVSKDGMAGNPGANFATDMGIGLKLVDYRVGLLGGNWRMNNLCGGKGVRLSLDIPLNGAGPSHSPADQLPSMNANFDGDES